MTNVWRYYLPALADHSDSWSIVFIDSGGCVAVCSDYGDWCYRWVTKHTGSEDFRDFFVDVGWDYVARKFGRGRPEELQVYDGPATAANIRRHIRERRRDGSLSKEEARHEWNLVGGEVEDGILGYHEWYQSTQFDCAYEHAIYTMAAGLKHWATASLPRLQAAIREELAAERKVGA